MIHALINTNVFVSALIAPAGNEAMVVLAIKQVVEFIVTGNKRHFPAPSPGIEVVNAGELLDRVTREM